MPPSKSPTRVAALLATLAVAVVLMLAGCSSEQAAEKSGDSKGTGAPRAYPYTAAATTGMVADMVRAIGGPHANVVQIMGAGVDPHLYTPSRSDVGTLSSADIVFYSGLLLEGRMTDVLTKIGRGRPVYAVTERIPNEYLLEVVGGHPDPHVWMDVSGWMQSVGVATEALAAFDAPHAEEYRERGAAYAAELKKLDEYARVAFATIPEEQRVMVTAHDAFNYLGRAYRIEVLGIQGISTESEAGLQDINGLVTLLVERKVPAVFVETSVSDKNVRALLEGAAARGHKVRIGGTLFSDAMGEAGTYEGTYVGMIDHNVTTIVRALGGDAPERGMQGKLAGGPSTPGAPPK